MKKIHFARKQTLFDRKSTNSHWVRAHWAEHERSLINTYLGYFWNIACSRVIRCVQKYEIFTDRFGTAILRIFQSDDSETAEITLKSSLSLTVHWNHNVFQSKNIFSCVLLSDLKMLQNIGKHRVCKIKPISPLEDSSRSEAKIFKTLSKHQKTTFCVRNSFSENC